MRMIILFIIVVCCVASATAGKTDRNKEKCEDNRSSSEKDGQNENVKIGHTAKDEHREEKDRENKDNKRNKDSNEDNRKNYKNCEREEDNDISMRKDNRSREWENKKDECDDEKSKEKTSDCHCGNNVKCPDIYDPVCALPDGFCNEPRTFSSSFVLDYENCVNPNHKYKYFHRGECKTTPEEQCNRMCPAIYDPVCALPDGFCGEPKTYSSSCALASENCVNPNQKYKYFHDGECIPQRPVCSEICPDIYEPICATGPSGDQKRFPNKCDFESYNCLNVNNQYTYIYDGECKECWDVKCNKIYQPVCASNSKGIMKTFGNPCLLQLDNCQCSDDLYTYSYDGGCIVDSPIICTMEYAPVCATSSTLGSLNFSNKCEQDAYISQHPDEGYSHAYDGECKPQCADACPDIYEPVCSSDIDGMEKTWANQCELDMYNCKNPNNQCNLLYEGECKPKCWKVCTKEYMPVCAKNCNGTLESFENQCSLDNYNCEHPSDLYTLLYNRECKPVCNDACTRDYNPVCGRDSNGKTETFSNKCVFESYRCNHPEEGYSYLSEGECKPNCIEFCTEIYSPICGTTSNGKTQTFGNQCEFDKYSCKHPNEIYITSTKGECKAPCNDVCLEVNKPVCASPSGGINDKKAVTFFNQCKLDAYNCHNPKQQFIKAADGECPVNCKTLTCPDKGNWICAVPNGFEGKPSSFLNDCQRQLHNCANPKNKYDYFADDKCDNGC